MMTQRTESWSRQVRRHRNIYRFGGVWAQTLLAAAPWLDALVVVVLLLAVNQRMVVAPGVVFDLPRAPFREGLHAGMTALMLAVPGERLGDYETLVFFDDDRFVARDVDQMAVLEERVRGRVALGKRRDLLLLADKRVPHGDVVRFVNAVREAGVQRVSVAEKPE